MKYKLLPLTIIAGTATLGLLADEQKKSEDPTPKIVSPWERDDGQWITLSGKVTDAGANDFKLDYGKGAITVEMDDYDPELEAFNIVRNDRVIVVGRVDADRKQRRTIEAASVYVKNVGKAFFASPDDDEEAVMDLRKATLEGTQLVLTGKITSLMKDWLVLDTGYQLLTVSTQGIGRNSTDDPIPDEIKKLKIGNQIRIFGAVTDGFMDSDKLIASRIEKL